MLTPTFVNVAGGEYDINQFQILGATKDKKADIQVLDENGIWIGAKHYYWFLEYTDKHGVTYPAGWYNYAGSKMSEDTLEPGDTLYLTVSAENLKLVIPGALAK